MRRQNVQSNEREKLEWEEEEILSLGQVKARITSATKKNGYKMYSVSFFKEYNDRRSGFFRSADMDSLSDLARSVKHWIDADGVDNENRDLY